MVTSVGLAIPTVELGYSYVEEIAFHRGDVAMLLNSFSPWAIHTLFIAGTLLLALALFDVEYWQRRERRESNKRVVERLTTLLSRTRIVETPEVPDT